SGVGKTSLIRAGVLPELEQPDHTVAAIVFRDWQKSDFERQLRVEILESLLASLNRIQSLNKTLEELEAAFCKGLQLESIDALYQLPLQRLIRECCAVLDGRLFFIFDQFEEYIYYHPLALDGTPFDAAFANAVNDKQLSASFLLSLREDGLGKLDRLRPRIPDLLGNVIKIELLDKEGAEKAIEIPLE